MLCALALAALAWTHTTTLLSLYVIAALLGVARAFAGPALGALAPNLVPREILPRAIALSSIAWQTGAIGGPALGGYLYALAPVAPYAASALLFVIALFGLFAIPTLPRPELDRSRQPWRQMVEGLRYVRHNRLVLGAISLDLFAVLLGGATAMLPVFARDVLHAGPEGLGHLRAAPAVGATLTAAFFAVRPLKTNVGTKMLVAVAVFGGATIVFGVSRSMPLSLACLALLGAADMFSVYVRQSLIQLYTPDEMRGRVGAVSSLFISASNELGEAESGFLAALIGPIPAVIAGGIGAVLRRLPVGLEIPRAAACKKLRRTRFEPLTHEGEPGMKAANVLETIGNTPHIRINRLFGDRAEVWMKSERANPGGSIKDRIALAMVEDAERSGKLKPGGTIIEPTSGNTGIGLSMVAAVKGYKIILVMPESMSIERRRLMLAYGAKFDLTAKEKGMQGAVDRARELVEQTPGGWMPQQFDNQANVEVHRRTTAQEILRDFADTPIDAIITGVGTGGHITACAEVLKPVWPNLKVFAVEPALAPLLSGGKAGPHPIQGLGANFIPSILNTGALDGIIDVDAEDAKEMARRAAREEGLLIGMSSGAALAGVEMKLPELGERPRILTFNYDTGERYLSVPDFLPEETA